MNECMPRKQIKSLEGLIQDEAPIWENSCKETRFRRERGPSLGLSWAGTRRGQWRWESLCPWVKGGPSPACSRGPTCIVNPEMFSVSSGEV